MPPMWTLAFGTNEASVAGTAGSTVASVILAVGDTVRGNGNFMVRNFFTVHVPDLTVTTMVPAARISAHDDPIELELVLALHVPVATVGQCNRHDHQDRQHSRQAQRNQSCSHGETSLSLPPELWSG